MNIEMAPFIINEVTLGQYVSVDNDLKYLVLTIDRTILTLEKSIEFARHANSKGLCVIFDADTYEDSTPISSAKQHKILLDIASHSQDDVMTAVMAGICKVESTVDYGYIAFGYTYNQKVGDVVLHAESVLAKFFKDVEFDFSLFEPHSWLMLLEPCFHCLLDMVETGAEVIAYYDDHKEKWNTPEYLELKRKLHWAGSPVYTKEVIVE